MFVPSDSAMYLLCWAWCQLVYFALQEACF